jgi:hypothetical protein
MEGAIVPNAASGIVVHFPSQCRPQDHLQQLAGRMEKLQQRGEQLGADCSTDRAVLLLGEAARGTEYGGWTGMGVEGLERSGWWPSIWGSSRSRSRSWGSPRSVGRAIGPRGQNFHQWGYNGRHGIPGSVPQVVRLSNLPLLRFPYSIETQEHAGAGGSGPPMNAVAVRCLINNDSSVSQRGLPEWIENSKVLRRIYLVWASLACVKCSFKC